MNNVKDGWNLIEYTQMPESADDIRLVKDGKVLTRRADGLDVETCMRWGWKFTPVNVVEETEAREKDIKIQELERQISYLKMAMSTPEKWKERYERIRKIHVEDVRRRLETRRFRAVNFSIEELTEALERKRLGKNPPPKENWGAMLVSALQLAKDIYDTLWKIQKYIPEEEKKKYYIFHPGKNGFGHRIYRLEKMIQEARKRALESYEKPRF